MKRYLLIFAILWLGAGVQAAQGPSGSQSYSLRLDFDKEFEDGAQVIIHERLGMPESPAILWLSGKFSPALSGPLPSPLPKLTLKRVIKTTLGSATFESEASLETYGEYFGCALDLKHKERPPAADETYEISLNGTTLTTLTPAWIASWTFNPAAEVFFPFQFPADATKLPEIPLRVKIAAHPTKPVLLRTATLRRENRSATATETAGMYAASLPVHGAPEDPRLFLDVVGDLGAASGVVPWVQAGPLVFVLGDHGSQYFRAKAGTGNLTELSPRNTQGELLIKRPTRCWYWDAGQKVWLRSVGDQETAFASGRYFLDGWRAASALTTGGTAAGGVAAGLVFIDEKFSAIIDPSHWAPGLSSAPATPAWPLPDDLRTRLGEPAVVIWCVGQADARARSWQVIFDPAAHANEASPEYLTQLHDTLEARIALWTPPPGAKAPQHVVIPPPEAFGGSLKFNSQEDPAVASRLGAQTVQNALSFPKNKKWIAVVSTPPNSTENNPSISVPAFNGLRAYALGWALGLQYALPTGP